MREQFPCVRKLRSSPDACCTFRRLDQLEQPSGAIDARVRAVFFASDARVVARCDFHSACAGARERFAMTNGFGPRPLPAAIFSIDRLEATDASSSDILFFFPSRENLSRCLIRKQLVRFSPSRWRIRVRIHPPPSFSPSSVKSSLPFAKARSGSPQS